MTWNALSYGKKSRNINSSIKLKKKTNVLNVNCNEKCSKFGHQAKNLILLIFYKF